MFLRKFVISGCLCYSVCASLDNSCAVVCTCAALYVVALHLSWLGLDCVLISCWNWFVLMYVIGNSCLCKACESNFSWCRLWEAKDGSSAEARRWEVRQSEMWKLLHLGVAGVEVPEDTADAVVQCMQLLLCCQGCAPSQAIHGAVGEDCTGFWGQTDQKSSCTDQWQWAWISRGYHSEHQAASRQEKAPAKDLGCRCHYLSGGRERQVLLTTVVPQLFRTFSMQWPNLCNHTWQNCKACHWQARASLQFGFLLSALQDLIFSRANRLAPYRLHGAAHQPIYNLQALQPMPSWGLNWPALLKLLWGPVLQAMEMSHHAYL